MHRGGQVSIEFLIITGFSMLLLIPLILLFYTQGAAVQGDLVEAQTTASVDAMIQSAERVYYAGPPSRETITVSFPEYVESVEVRNSSIAVGLRYPRSYDVVRPTDVPLVESSLGVLQGRLQLRVEATVGGVLISRP